MNSFLHTEFQPAVHSDVFNHMCSVKMKQLKSKEMQLGRGPDENKLVQKKDVLSVIWEHFGFIQHDIGQT